MMDFVLMTLSFFVAIMMASGLSLAVVMNKKVLKWYMKKCQVITEEVLDESLDELY